MPLFRDLLFVQDLLLDLLKLLFIVAEKHLGCSHKDILDSLSTLGGGLEIEMNPLFLLKSLGTLKSDLAVCLEILFSSYKEHKHVRIAVLRDHLFLPLTHIVE